MRKQLHKKIITGAVILSMSAMLFACQSKNDNLDVGSGTETTSNPETTIEADDDQNLTTLPGGDSTDSDVVAIGGTDSTEGSDTTDKPETSDTNNTPDSNHEPIKVDIATASLEEIMDAIYSNVASEMTMRFDTEIEKDTTSYYFGVENMDIEEALASESVTSIAHSVCLARVKDGTDMEALKKEIKEKVDPRKWICVGVDPESVLVDNIGNLVILVMTNFSPQEIMDSFLSLNE